MFVPSGWECLLSYHKTFVHSSQVSLAITCSKEGREGLLPTSLDGPGTLNLSGWDEKFW